MRPIALARILSLTLLLLTTACTNIVNSVTEGPIEPDPTATGVGTNINDLKMDTYIGVNIKKADEALAKSHINVNVYNAVVLLTGEVPNPKMKVLAGDVARDFSGVRQVHNELQVRGKSSMVARTNDSLLTGKIKTKMALDQSVKASDIQIVTEDSVVYLMGKVIQAEGEAAANIARASSGVRKVVKVFEYVD
jgi:osmotically-inducible protein OsmY